MLAMLAKLALASMTLMERLFIALPIASRPELPGAAGVRGLAGQPAVAQALDHSLPMLSRCSLRVCRDIEDALDASRVTRWRPSARDTPQRDNAPMDIEKFPTGLMQHIGFSGLVRSDAETGMARVRFIARPEFAHTHGTVVQGGMVTAWLDCAIAFAVTAKDPTAGIASLELKVSFLDRADVATFEAEAQVLRWGRSVVFLESNLYATDGRLIARASSTGKLIRR